MAEPTLVETDSRGRAVLPGHPSRRFAMHVNEDGSILLQPILAATNAQREFESDPELQDLLARATGSASICRSRRGR